MTVPTLVFPSYALRLLLLAMLTVGMVVNPMLAAACGICDVQQSAKGEQEPAASEVPSADEDCCSASNCNSCCSHTVAVQTPFDGAAAAPATTSVLSVRSVDFEPIFVPVALRPPIAT